MGCGTSCALMCGATDTVASASGEPPRRCSSSQRPTDDLAAVAPVAILPRSSTPVNCRAASDSSLQSTAARHAGVKADGGAEHGAGDHRQQWEFSLSNAMEAPTTNPLRLRLPRDGADDRHHISLASAGDSEFSESGAECRSGSCGLMSQETCEAVGWKTLAGTSQDKTPFSVDEVREARKRQLEALRQQIIAAFHAREAAVEEGFVPSTRTSEGDGGVGDHSSVSAPHRPQVALLSIDAPMLHSSGANSSDEQHPVALMSVADPGGASAVGAPRGMSEVEVQVNSTSRTLHTLPQCIASRHGHQKCVPTPPIVLTPRQMHLPQFTACVKATPPSTPVAVGPRPVRAATPTSTSAVHQGPAAPLESVLASHIRHLSRRDRNSMISIDWEAVERSHGMAATPPAPGRPGWAMAGNEQTQEEEDDARTDPLAGLFTRSFGDDVVASLDHRPAGDSSTDSGHSSSCGERFICNDTSSDVEAGC